MMRLTWKDAIATLFMAASASVYAAFLAGADLPLISSTRGTATAVLILGTVGGCSLGQTSDLYNKVRTGPEQVYLMAASAAGLTALVAAVIALIGASEIALAILFAATALLWLLATGRHAFTTATGYAPAGRDTHETIDWEHARH